MQSLSQDQHCDQLELNLHRFSFLHSAFALENLQLKMAGICQAYCNVRLTNKLCRLQALKWLHARGRSHNDLKNTNIMVRFTEDGSTYEHVMLIDAGSSAKIKGDHVSHV